MSVVIRALVVTGKLLLRVRNSSQPSMDRNVLSFPELSIPNDFSQSSALYHLGIYAAVLICRIRYNRCGS